jgi:tetratricopeptide (TPR) repeat protein
MRNKSRPCICANHIILLILSILLGAGHLPAQVKLTGKAWVLPTWPVAPPDRNPVFFRGEAYQGASRHYYPLALNDQFIQERKEQSWHTLVLENEFIELAITPEIGGKLYYATDKTNDYHFIYKNNVVKPSNIGMTGAWVSGGIEWCVLHHHRASTYLPVDYTTSENADGSKTIWVGESEPRHGMRWTIGVTLHPGKSYFEVEGRIHNASPLTHTFLYWANVAAHTNENYQTIFPPSAQVATYHSKTSFTRWPFSTEVYTGNDFTGGVDISWWKNVVNSNSFFVHDLKEDFMGGYDHGKNSGTVHIGDHNIVKGAKLWEWGSGARGQATEGRLTENDGPYVELMTGAYSDNQPDYSWIRPYEVKTWKQYWYPVKGIQGFKNANLNGAVNLEARESNSVFLGYYSTQTVDKAKVILKNKDKIIYEKTIAISPAHPFAETIRMDGVFNTTKLYTELVNSSTNEVLLSYQPVELVPVAELPEEVKGYTDPSEIETVEELFLTGSRVEQFYSPRNNPMDWYLEALKRDPGDVRTNTAVGNRYLKNGDYENARRHLGIAIKRLTKDYTRPSSGEALYLQGLTLKALGLYKEATDTLYRAAWDYAWHSAACFQLAQISVMDCDYEKALHEINESLWTNARNNRAVALKAAILRKLGQPAEAIAALSPFIEADPLDFRLRNEQYLAVKAMGDPEATGLLNSLTSLMRDFDQNYLETAAGYIDDGLLAGAGDLLLRYKGENPIVNYYLGYVYDRTGNPSDAKKQFTIAAGKPTDYIFPHRLKTIDVLQTALKYNPSDDKAHYYIGNILYEKQPEKAMASWEKATTLNPQLAVAFRNLGWGYYRHKGDGQKAIQAYEKAIDINKNEPIYYSELDALYEMSNTPVEIRLKLFEGSNGVVRQRDDSFIRQIAVLTLAGQPEKAVEYLEGAKFAYREGTSRVREMMIDAQIMAGKKYLAENNIRKALDHFLAAQIGEEEAGSARFGNRDIQVSYYIGMAYSLINDHGQAQTHFKRAISHEARETDIMGYYRGMAFEKLGEKEKAGQVFEAMIEAGNRQITDTSGQTEYGVIFGEREAENTRKSQSFTLRGLGYKGAGKQQQASEDLKKAVELSYSNLWAKAELDMN